MAAIDDPLRIRRSRDIGAYLGFAGRLKVLSNSIVSLRSPIVGLSQLARTISLRRMNIAAESGAHWPFLSDTRRVVQKDLDILRRGSRSGRPQAAPMLSYHAALRSRGINRQSPDASRSRIVVNDPNSSGVTPRIQSSMRSASISIKAALARSCSLGK